jgi:hypothetical protein
MGKFRRCVAGVRPGRARERSRGPKGPVCGSLGARDGRLRGARRRPVAPAAVAGNAGEGWPQAVGIIGRRAVVELEEGVGASIGSGGGWGGGAPVAAFQERWRAPACVRGSRQSP